MEPTVLKFGGTSVNTPGNRLFAASHIQKKIEAGEYPVVVVSAIGRRSMPYATDMLLDFALDTHSKLSPREHDLLVSCGEIISAVIMVQTLASLNIKASALTGAQAGIITDKSFGQGSVKKVIPSRIIRLIERGVVPIIAGFQGITEDGEVTTLGRGGSDTTASIVAVAINAKTIEIFSDVDGIMTADPKIVSNPNIIAQVSYDEVCELAYKGSKVVHPQCVETAKEARIPIMIKSNFSHSPGTLVHVIKNDCPVTAVASRQNIVFAHITPQSYGDYSTGLRIFELLATQKISVDFVDIRPNEITFIIERSFKKKVESILYENNFVFSLKSDFAKVSVVGSGMTGEPGILSKIIDTLINEDICIFQITDSYTSISCLIKQEQENRAITSLHASFGLS